MTVKGFYNKGYDYNARAPYFIEKTELTQSEWYRLTESETFCMMPWVHMHAFPDGRAYPCCLSEYFHPVGDLRKNTMKEIWNQNPYKTMRTNMLQDKPCKECTKCYEQESHGAFSMRNDANRNYGHLIKEVAATEPDGTNPKFKIRYWDVRFSNLCNFRCRTCGPIFSSNWYNDHVKLYNRVPDVLKRPMERVEYTAGNEDGMLEQMEEHIPYLEQVYFAGGEPLIMKEHYYLLEKLIEAGKTDIRLQYNTNFSEMRFKDKHVFDYWKHFKNVSVGASLDASGPRAELIRKGTDWAQTVDNRRRMIEEVPHVDFYISATVSSMNVLHVLDFHREWTEQGLIKAKDFNVNICQSPDWYRADIFPEQFKRNVIAPAYETHIAWLEPQDNLQRATNGFKSMLSFITGADNSKNWPRFVEECAKLDNIRNENFWEIFPEFKDVKYFDHPTTMCMLPWVSVETSPIGSARPCCLAIDEITDDTGRKYDLNQDTLSTIYNSKYMQDLRQEFRDGKKPETCKRCWEEEDAGRTSKRIHTLVRFKDRYAEVDWDNNKPDQLWFLDLKLGNICNLKCRICGSWSSSKWVPEEMDYVKARGIDPKKHIAYTWLKQGNWPRNENSAKFWEDLKTILPHIKYFEFTGGEPFMIQEHFDLLKFAADNGYADNIEIHYNTNGTQFPEEFITTWKQFRKVEIAFSIDNTGERFEYERSGAKWAEVEANINRFHSMRDSWPNLHTQVCMTINVQNVYYLEELCNWVSKQNFDYDYFNMMHDPKLMNIGSMTEQAKELVIDKLNTGTFSTKHRKEIDRIIQFIKNGTTLDNTQFLKEMKRTDAYRGEDFSKTHSEIARAMGYED